MIASDAIDKAMALLDIMASPDKYKALLAELRDAHAGHDERMAELEARASAVAIAEKLARENDKIGRELAQKEAEIEDKAKRLSQLRELDEAQRRRDRMAAADREASLRAREQHLERMQAELDGQVAAHALRVAEREKQLGMRDAEQDAREKRLNEWESRLHVQANELETRRRELDRRAA